MTETKSAAPKLALVKLKRDYFPADKFRVEGEFVEPTTRVRGKVNKGHTIELPGSEAKRVIDLGIGERADSLE